MNSVHKQNETKSKEYGPIIKNSILRTYLQIIYYFYRKYKNLHTSFTVVAHLTEGLSLNALLTLKVESSLICLVGTRILCK
jgi:hypothetical protein